MDKFEQLVLRLEKAVQQLESGKQSNQQDQQDQHPITEEIIENCQKLLELKKLSEESKHPQVIIDKIQKLYDNYLIFSKIAAMPFKYKKPQQEKLVELIKPLAIQGQLPPFEFADYNKCIENSINFMQVLFSNNIDQFFQDYSGIVEFNNNKIRRQGNKQWPALLTQFMNGLKQIYENYYGAKINWKGNQEYTGQLQTQQSQQIQKEEKKQEEKPQEKKQEKPKEKQPVCKYDSEQKIYKIENYNGNNEPIKISDISLMTTIEIFNCQNITVIIEKKCKLIQILKCKKVKIQCESVISDINFLYCEQSKCLIRGNIGSINLENSGDIQMQFINNPEDVDFNLFSSKEIKVYYEDDEYAIPDHYICKIKDKQVKLEVVDVGAE